MATKSPVKVTESATAYLAYLKATQKVRNQSNAPAISPEEESVLNALALHWRAGKPLAVREAMALRKLASPSTMHRRITKLKDVGLIADEHLPGNLRIKLLVPTNKALAHFERLGRALS